MNLVYNPTVVIMEEDGDPQHGNKKREGYYITDVPWDRGEGIQKAMYNVLQELGKRNKEENDGYHSTNVIRVQPLGEIIIGARFTSNIFGEPADIIEKIENK